MICLKESTTFSVE